MACMHARLRLSGAFLGIYLVRTGLKGSEAYIAANQPDKPRLAHHLSVLHLGCRDMQRGG